MMAMNYNNKIQAFQQQQKISKKMLVKKWTKCQRSSKRKQSSNKNKTSTRTHKGSTKKTHNIILEQDIEWKKEIKINK